MTGERLVEDILDAHTQAVQAQAQRAPTSLYGRLWTDEELCSLEAMVAAPTLDTRLRSRLLAAVTPPVASVSPQFLAAAVLHLLARVEKLERTCLRVLTAEEAAQLEDDD